MYFLVDFLLHTLWGVRFTSSIRSAPQNCDGSFVFLLTGRHRFAARPHRLMWSIQSNRARNWVETVIPYRVVYVLKHDKHLTSGNWFEVRAYDRYHDFGKMCLWAWQLSSSSIDLIDIEDMNEMILYTKINYKQHNRSLGPHVRENKPLSNWMCTRYRRMCLLRSSGQLTATPEIPSCDDRGWRRSLRGGYYK